MGKKTAYIIFVLAAASLFTACSAGRDHEEKLRDIEFTVVSPSELPEELAGVMEEKEEEGFQLTYADRGCLYLARGYGERETSGYSVEVEECYETENLVCIKTGLTGPSKEEEIVEESTYPYAVVKMEYIEKDVVFK